MPYLILAALTEGGLFTEMAKLSRNIVHFHEGARRDTLASVAKSFTFCNYAKGLELGGFCDRCQRSTQLALSRSEVPLFEVIDKLPTLPAIAAYLQGYVAHMHPESQNELSEESLRNLVDNMDYDLLTRVDEDPSIGSETDRLARRRQYELRMKRAQSLLRMIFTALQNDLPGATSRINGFFADLWEDSPASTIPLEDPFGAPFSLSKTSSVAKNSILWSQDLSSGSIDDQSFEKRNLEVVARLCALTVTAVQLDQVVKTSAASSSDPSESEAALHLRQTLRQISQSLHNLLAEIRQVLGEDDRPESMRRKFLESVGSGDVLLRPSWIRKASCVSRSLGAWGPVLLAHLQATLFKDSKKKKAKKGKGPADSEEQIAIVGIAQELKRLLGKTSRPLCLTSPSLVSLENDLERASHQPPSANQEVIEYIRASCHSLSHGLADEQEASDITTGAIDRSVQCLAKQLLSSQELACSRLRETVRNKRNLFESP
jgi:hypothetical protein